MIVCLLALDGMLTTSLSLPLEMLTAANHIYRASQRHTKINPLNIQIVSTQLRTPIDSASIPNQGHPLTTPQSQPTKSMGVLDCVACVVTAAGGMQILPHTTYHSINKASVIFLPSFWRNPKALSEHSPQLCQWLIEQHQAGARICATGTGVFLLAATGLLDGLPATTHWFYLDRLQALYPQIQLKKHHLLTRAGRLYCAGSVNSIADLTVHLISELYDKTIATKVAQQFSPEIRHRHTNFFDLLESHSPHQDETIVLIQQWLQQHYGEVIAMPEVAQRFSMSQRTLNRRFVGATGFTPSQWLLQIRVERARELLASTNLEISDIAAHCGFQDASYFSRVFRQHMATTPLLYRTSVRGKLFTP